MPENRDQLFEKALARHLRADGTSPSSCLDPETLAAYHERMLSAEELGSAKSHIVSCARCQEVLAQLETTPELNEMQEGEAVPVRAVVVTASATSPKRRDTPPQVVESDQAAAPSEKVVPIPPRKYSSLRWAAPAGAIAAALLLWIGARDARVKTSAPASSAQVAENRPPAPPSPAREESKDLGQPKEAEKQKAEAPLADQLSEVAPATRPKASPEVALRDEEDQKNDAAMAGKLESQSKKPSAAYQHSMRTGTGIGGGRGPSNAAAQAQVNNALERGDQAVSGGAAQTAQVAPPPDLDKAEAQKTRLAPTISAGASGFAQPAPPPPPPPSGLKRAGGRLRGTVTDPSGAVVAGASVVLKSPDGGPVASTSTDSGGAYSFSSVAAGNYQLELQSPGFKTDTLTGLNITAGDNVMNARLEVGTTAETVEVTAQPLVLNLQAAEVTAAPERKGRNLQALLLASSGFETAASPDGKSIWKFGELGQILHSRNAGKEWAAQISGVAVKLLAASAPSAKVCWIAGAAGTLLRTTDGGKHWQRITVPITGDLGGVHASDGQHASIWNAPNHLGYETSDGGMTWKQSANE